MIDAALQEGAQRSGQRHTPAVDLEEDLATRVDEPAQQVDGGAIALA
jgi:hypothetical protein